MSMALKKYELFYSYVPPSLKNKAIASQMSPETGTDITFQGDNRDLGL